MGFFNSCLEVLLRLSALGHFNGQDLTQQPLPLPGVVVRPHHASEGFVCHYPTLKGWESCNTAKDRQCWIKDPSGNNPLWSKFDIHTLCTL